MSRTTGRVSGCYAVQGFNSVVFPSCDPGYCLEIRCTTFVTRISSMERQTRDFQDSAKRIYMEVEDVGKTVKASKRRARWTFSFGDDGEEKVGLILGW
jgi:hypothetical protein